LALSNALPRLHVKAQVDKKKEKSAKEIITGKMIKYVKKKLMLKIRYLTLD
jgi:hypothetical protein